MKVSKVVARIRGLAPAILFAFLSARLAGCDPGQVTGAGGDPAGDLTPADAGVESDAADPGSVAADAAPGSVGSDAAVVPPSGRYHPAAFADPANHGPELKLQKQDCRGCHGATLEGQGAAPSCDSCHSASAPKAWRTTCTFCHGGTDNPTGAPPRGLDGSTGAGVFAPHTRHVSTTIAASIDCVQCHVKPADVLSVGHAFDTTPAVAEVDLSGGRSKQGSFDASARACSNLYCHGNGRADNGQVSVTAATMTCTSCHAGLASGSAARGTMSGRHALHLGIGGVTCGECHQAVTRDGVTIADASLHVNGARDLKFAAPGFSFNAGAQTCTGTCHGENHGNRRW